jgi:hypothetical protein
VADQNLLLTLSMRLPVQNFAIGLKKDHNIHSLHFADRLVDITSAKARINDVNTRANSEDAAEVLIRNYRNYLT